MIVVIFLAVWFGTAWSTTQNMVITTIAGTGTSSYSGDGGAATSATLSYPSRVALDSSGILFSIICLLDEIFVIPFFFHIQATFTSLIVVIIVSAR